MKGKIIVGIFIIIMASLLFLQCKSKPEKPTTSQPSVAKTDDSTVFKELRRIGTYHKADSFYNNDINDSAIYYYNKTLTDINLPKNPKFIHEVFNRIGYTYIRLSNYKKARQFLTKALKLTDEKNPDLVDANTLDFWGLMNHYQNESDSALFYLNKAYKVYSGVLGDKNLQIVKLNTQIGDVYRWSRFDYYNAEKYYYKALQIFESQGFDSRNDQYFRILYNLATTNRLKKDFNKALLYGLQALELARTIEKHKRYIETCYALVANIYLALKDYKLSIEYYNKAIEINSKASKINTEYRALYLKNLGWANYKLANYKIAISYCKQAFEIFNNSALDFNEISFCHEYLGLSYQALNQWPMALENFKQCVALRLKNLGIKHPNTADAYSLLGKYYESRHNLDSAMYYYQLAIVSGSKEYNGLNGNKIPSLAQTTTNIKLIDYIANKASALKQKYSQNPEDTVSILASFKCYELLDSMVSYSRKSMDMEQSKLSFSVNSNEVYEDAIECAFQLYQKENDNQYIRKAFMFFEKNKYLLLLEKLKIVEAVNKAGVPDSLVERERNLNSEVKFAQDKLATEQSKKDASAIQEQSLNAHIFNLMREIEKLHSLFEHQYPNYFKIKYQDVTLNLDDLQKYAILKGTNIIQYFWGEKSVYIIGVSENGLRFFRINNSPEFKDSLAGFIGMMHDANFTSKDKYREYAKTANYLYERIVKPVLTQTVPKNSESQTLTIIPDGMLSKLSFDALITSLANTSKFSYKNLLYLVYQYNIEYAYSSNILLGNPTRDRRQYANKLLGFGYSEDVHVSKKRFSMNGLPGTGNEMKTVSGYFRSRIYLGQNASEYNFKKNASKYDMIHLALHGSADEEKESGSKLMFRTEKDTVEDGLLYANEIYNLNLKAKLVVLSACETGIGKNYQGEGVFSLSRAFAYAGCPSIVISLWKVNDKSTSTLMGNFYKHLSDGDAIGKSLHCAKLEYLESSDEIGSQPVFWASFVAFGDMSPIKRGGDHIFWLVLIVIIVGGFFMYRLGLLREIFCRHQLRFFLPFINKKPRKTRGQFI